LKDSNNNITAVVCAAGVGSRLLPLTEDFPKTLVPIMDKTIIEYILDALSDCGVSEVVIVVGYKADMVKNKLGTSYKNCKITYIYNIDYAITNNIYSLWLARHEITDGMVFFNGDIVFNKNILGQILDSEYPDSLVVDSQIEISDDAMKVHVNEDKVVEIGKQIVKPPSGWAIGIYRLSKESTGTYFDLAEKLFDEGQKNISFVVPLQQMASDKSFMAVSTSGYGWAEIDDREDYEIAKKQVESILAG